LQHHMAFETVHERLAALGISGEDAERFWNTVRGNLDTLAEAVIWWRIVKEGLIHQPDLSEADRAFVRQAFDLLPEEPWDRTTWKAWTDAVREATERKGKALFMPLRLALTGLASGPELADLLPLLGREGTLARRP
ncbi:glutamate--tRNA ligase, partial [Rhizobiaceae sp. 2RAB30]